MLEKQKLNKLALDACNGCKSSRDYILSFFIPIIQKESNKLSNVIYDETSFEWCCYQAILRSIKNYDESVKSFYNVVYKRIKTEASKHIRDKKINRIELPSLNALEGHGKDSYKEGTGFQPRDILANVESEVLVKEKVALLAKGDNRKRIILESWLIDGCMCDTEISGLLADKLGGKEKSHLRYIQRFKDECKLALAS